MKATLILENGRVFHGRAVGDTADRVFETVFHTGMAGYQELLTDPACAGAGVVMTYPLVGNYGVNEEDGQSEKPWAAALIMRHLAARGSNFRASGSLGDYLKEHHITGIEGVDTRAITRILRSQGIMKGMITCAESFCMEDVLSRIRAHRVTDAVDKVTTDKVKHFTAIGEKQYSVALPDYGVKGGYVESLRRRGCDVTVYPASTPAAELLAGGHDGIFLPGGPGDPNEYGELIAQVKLLYDSNLPLFAVGLGHQLLALATGARVTRLPYGHHSASHPVRETATGRAYNVAQNHNFAVAAESVDGAVAAVAYVSMADGSVEGLRYGKGNTFTVQFDPEDGAGPMGAGVMFDEFVDRMGG